MFFFDVDVVDINNPPVLGERVELVVRDEVGLEILLPVSDALHLVVGVGVDVDGTAEMIRRPAVSLIDRDLFLVGVANGHSEKNSKKQIKTYTYLLWRAMYHYFTNVINIFYKLIASIHTKYQKISCSSSGHMSMSFPHGARRISFSLFYVLT